MSRQTLITELRTIADGMRKHSDDVRRLAAYADGQAYYDDVRRADELRSQAVTLELAAKILEGRA